MKKDITHELHELEWFQFPSNGKSYPKGTLKNAASDNDFKFQFPSNGKSYPKDKLHSLILKRDNCFNSLQTGNHIQRNISFLFLNCLMIDSFNSLQTGNHIQRDYYSERQSLLNKVSIPFKREIISKVRCVYLVLAMTRLFQFPSNGKSYPKRVVYLNATH